jgi:hypothetical protein
VESELAKTRSPASDVEAERILPCSSVPPCKTRAGPRGPSFMKRDTLGNLEQWGRALEQLDEWKRAGQLDDHQQDLLWLLRFRGNWRLREAALKMMASLHDPAPELIRQACHIMMNESLYHEVRMLAAEAVSALSSSKGNIGAPKEPLTDEIREHMRVLLESARPPAMHLTLPRLLPRIE